VDKDLSDLLRVYEARSQSELTLMGTLSPAELQQRVDEFLISWVRAPGSFSIRSHAIREPGASSHSAPRMVTRRFGSRPQTDAYRRHLRASGRFDTVLLPIGSGIEVSRLVR
jgi:hypothetical protein